MKHRRFAAAVVLSPVLGLVRPAAGQPVVGPEVLVSETILGRETDHNLEPIVAAVRNAGTGHDEVVVAWNSRQSQTTRSVLYRISVLSAQGWVAPPAP